MGSLTTEIFLNDLRKLDTLYDEMKSFLLNDVGKDMDIDIDIDNKLSEFLDRLADIAYEMDKGVF